MTKCSYVAIPHGSRDTGKIFLFCTQLNCHVNFVKPENSDFQFMKFVAIWC